MGQLLELGLTEVVSAALLVAWALLVVGAGSVAVAELGSDDGEVGDGDGEGDVVGDGEVDGLVVGLGVVVVGFGDAVVGVGLAVCVGFAVWPGVGGGVTTCVGGGVPGAGTAPTTRVAA